MYMLFLLCLIDSGHRPMFREAYEFDEVTELIFLFHTDTLCCITCLLGLGRADDAISAL